MAIKPGYKTFTFDGESSGDYGVYITGSAVYNAPERDVEMIKIPGRSGAFVQDNERFENIEVTYPAGIYAESQEDFAQAISDLRNMLASRKEYCRLTDEYNPEEYRMAVYKSGLDVDPVAFQRAGEFTITFDCKPQRWLTAGETPVAITSGDELTNPTLFEAGPLLAIKGYGAIQFNNYEVKLENAKLGPVFIREGEKNVDLTNSYDQGGVAFGLNPRLDQFLNTGDTITLEALIFKWNFKAIGETLDSVAVSSNSGISGSSASCTAGPEPNVIVSIPDLNFAKGTVSSYSNITVISGTRMPGSIAFTAQIEVTVTLLQGRRISINYQITYDNPAFSTIKVLLSYGDIMGDSSQPFLGDPTYIDCDLGDAYKIDGGEYVSLNRNVDLGSDLPVLAPGSNTVTFENTVTELKIIPRWWKV